MPLDVTGFRALRGSDIRDEIRADFEALSGVRPDWDRDTYLGPFSAAVANQLGNLSSAVQAINDARDPENAVGVSLSNIARFSGLTPIDATYSTFEAVVTGTAATVINANQIRVRVDGSDFEIVTDVVIGGGGTVAATFRAVTTGPRTATLGAAVGLGLTIETPLLGVSDVTVGVLTIGRDVETDAALYLRWRQSLQVRGARNIAAIRARILDDFPTITGCIVLENDQPTIEIIEGLSLDGPVVAVVVDPVQDSTTETALATMLYGLVAEGIRTHGAEQYTISGTGISAKVIRWTYGAAVNATLSIQIRIEPKTPGRPPPPSYAEAAANVTAAIEDFRATLGLGDDLTILDIQGIAGDVDGVRSVTAIVLASDPVDASKIDADGNLSITAAERVGTVVVTVAEAP